MLPPENSAFDDQLERNAQLYARILALNTINSFRIWLNYAEEVDNASKEDLIIRLLPRQTGLSRDGSLPRYSRNDVGKMASSLKDIYILTGLYSLPLEAIFSRYIPVSPLIKQYYLGLDKLEIFLEETQPLILLAIGKRGR